jgi:hypothetical protein
MEYNRERIVIPTFFGNSVSDVHITITSQIPFSSRPARQNGKLIQQRIASYPRHLLHRISRFVYTARIKLFMPC